MPLHVLSIGSCRVDLPLSLVRDRFQFRLNAARSYGYVHSSAEILQQVRWMKGELEIPEVLWHFISNRPYAETTPTGFQTDAVAIEISSINPVLFDGYAFQLNRMQEGLADFRELWQIWRKYPRQKHLGQRLDLLAKEDSFTHIDPLRRSILERATMQLQTTGELAGDLAKIKALMPESFLVVTNCSLGEDMPSMRSRNQALRVITEACEKSIISIFNPTGDIVTFGPDAAFTGNGQDVHHYTNEFSRHLGYKFAALLRLDDIACRKEKVDRKTLLTRRIKKFKIQKSPADALSLATELLALAPHALLAWEVAARASTLIGDAKTSQKSWDRVLHLDSLNAGLWIEAAAAAERFGDGSRALRLLGEAKVLGAKVDMLLTARILLASGDVDGALTSMRHYVAGDAEAGSRLMEMEGNAPWLAATACRAIADEHGAEVVEQIRGALFSQALAAAISASKDGDVRGETDNLRLMKFLAHGDGDLIMRANSVMAGTIGSAMATSARSPSGTQRLSSLLALESFSAEITYQAAILLAQSGHHEQAAEALDKALSRAKSEETQTIADMATQLGRAAIGSGDLTAAQAYVRLLHRRMPESSTAARLRSSLLKREIRKIGDMAAATGLKGVEALRVVLELDPDNVKALKNAAFARDVSVAERRNFLRRLLGRDTRYLSLVRKNLERAIKEEKTDLAGLYYSIFVSSVGKSEQTEIWRNKLVNQLTAELKDAVKTAPERVPAAADAALRFDPDNHSVLFMTARALVGQRACDAARPYLDRLLALNAKEEDTLVLVAKCEAHSATRRRVSSKVS